MTGEQIDQMFKELAGKIVVLDLQTRLAIYFASMGLREDLLGVAMKQVGQFIQLGHSPATVAGMN